MKVQLPVNFSCEISRPPTTSRASVLRAATLGLALLAGATAATAAGNDGLGLYVQGGHNFAHGTETDNLFIGAQIPWAKQSPSVTRYWDVYVGQWRGPDASGANKTYTNIAAAVVWRYRFDQGASNWYTEAGLGLSYLDDVYTKPGRSFSTRLNFNPRIGLGRSFGERGQHEVAVIYQHFSNAGIKKPNPGEDFAQLRYAYKF